MQDLNQVARFMFRQIAMVFALDCARDRRDGIRGSRIKAVKGSAGPELLLEAEDMTLRFWASKTGPGCTVVGAPVIGYLWCRWSVEPADRCIGVLVEDEGRVSWLTMAEGDLPAEGVIDIHQAAIRSGPDRMAELTWDLRFTAKARALARQLPRELPKALREKIRSYQKGGRRVATAPAQTATSCELGGHVWDLKYTATALRHLQMIFGSLEQFATQLLKENMGQGLSLKSQAILIWAGQRAVEPKLKLRWVERFLRTADPQIRLLLVTWATSDFARAVFELAAARLEAANPPVDPDDEDGEGL